MSRGINIGDGLILAPLEDSGVLGSSEAGTDGMIMGIAAF
jgi:hypothetical protein